MKISKHPFRYNFSEQFPDKREIGGFEGGVIYQATKDNRHYLVIDEGTMSEFLDDDDRDVMDQLVKVIEFETEEELKQYLKEQDGRITIFRK